MKRMTMTINGVQNKDQRLKMGKKNVYSVVGKERRLKQKCYTGSSEARWKIFQGHTALKNNSKALQPE